MSAQTGRLAVRLALLGACVLLISAAAAPVLAARAWQVSPAPSSLSHGTPTNINLSVTNTGGSGGGDEISCIQVEVPASFSIISASIVSIHGQGSGAAFDAWTVVWPGGNRVFFKEPTDKYPLIGSKAPRDEAVFRIRGSAQASGQMRWTAQAYHKPEKADVASCGKGMNSDIKTLTFNVSASPTPSPSPVTPPPATASPKTPTPAPGTPTPKPSTPTPKPATPEPKTPSPEPKTPTPQPSSVTPTPAAPAEPVASSSVEPSAEASASPTARASASTGPVRATNPPRSTAVPSGSPAATAQASGSPQASPSPVAGAGQLVISLGTDGGDENGNGHGRASAEGMGATVVTALQSVPGGMLAWSYPAVVLAVPGLLLIAAVLGQAMGALAWLPVVKRSLSGTGLKRSRQARQNPAEPSDH